MDKYEILSSDDERKEKGKIEIGLTPIFFFLFLILTEGVGVFVTYEKIRRKSKEIGESLNTVFIMNENINKANNHLVELINLDKENEKILESITSNIKNLNINIEESKNLIFNYSNQVRELDIKLQEEKKLLDEAIKINEISKKATNKLYKKLQASIKKYKSLKIQSEILDSDSEIDLIDSWIQGDDDNKFIYKIEKCYEYLNDSLNFNEALHKYYQNCIEKNKVKNNSLLILYQTIYYNRIGAFIKNKEVYQEQTNFVFNLKNKIKYDIADNLIQISNSTFPSFGLAKSQGPYDIRVFYSNNTIQINTTIINENQVKNTKMLHIEIFLLS